MKSKNNLLTIISLVAMLSMLAIAYGLDRVLQIQQREAIATFQFAPYLLLSILGVLVFVATWLAFSWFILIIMMPSMMIGVTYGVVGLTILLYPFVSLLFPPLPILPYSFEPRFTYTSVFITVIGLLTILRASQSKSREL